MKCSLKKQKHEENISYMLLLEIFCRNNAEKNKYVYENPFLQSSMKTKHEENLKWTENFVCLIESIY